MIALIVLAALATSEQTSVELSTRGDCSLCQQFNGAVEEGLRRSSSFQAADSETPSQGHSVLVGLDRFDMGQHFSYRAEMFDGAVEVSSPIASISGRCDVEELRECADELWRMLAREIGTLSLTAGEPAERVPIAFWHQGDDGLSYRFYEALRREIEHSTTLLDMRTGGPVRYLLYGEGHVAPLDLRQQHFAYRVSLRAGPTSDSAILARFDGHCRKPPAECADEVVSRVEQWVGSAE